MNEGVKTIAALVFCIAVLVFVYKMFELFTSMSCR